MTVTQKDFDAVQAWRAEQGLDPLPAFADWVAAEDAFTAGVPSPEQAARDAALAAVTAPLTAPAITGTTVAAVKASAQAGLDQLAQDFTTRLATLVDQLGT